MLEHEDEHDPVFVVFAGLEADIRQKLLSEFGRIWPDMISRSIGSPDELNAYLDESDGETAPRVPDLVVIWKDDAGTPDCANLSNMRKNDNFAHVPYVVIAPEEALGQIRSAGAYDTDLFASSTPSRDDIHVIIQAVVNSWVETMEYSPS